MDAFPKATTYISTIDINTCDPLDKIIKRFMNDYPSYERASQALRRRFVRGAEYVDGIDRSNRKAKIKRVMVGGKYKYYIEGMDGSWNEPEERIWVVAMYALWQENKFK